MLDFGYVPLDADFVRRVLYAEKLHVANADPCMVQLWMLVADVEAQVEAIQREAALVRARCDHLAAGDYPPFEANLWPPS